MPPIKLPTDIIAPAVKAQPTTAEYFSRWQKMTCPTCGNEYLLGKTGTIYGCDHCLGITRNPVDGTIIYGEQS